MFTREAAKVSAAASFGSMYNPFIRDGLAVAASGTWGGEPLRVVGRRILEDGDAVALSSLLDPVEYQRQRIGTGQALAGSFVEYVISTRGAEVFVELYREQGSIAGSAVEAAETVLGSTVDEIDTQWKDYLRTETQSGAEQAAAVRP